MGVRGTDYRLGDQGLVPSPLIFLLPTGLGSNQAAGSCQTRPCNACSAARATSVSVKRPQRIKRFAAILCRNASRFSIGNARAACMNQRPSWWSDSDTGKSRLIPTRTSADSNDASLSHAVCTRPSHRSLEDYRRICSGLTTRRALKDSVQLSVANVGQIGPRFGRTNPKARPAHAGPVSDFSTNYRGEPSVVPFRRRIAVPLDGYEEAEKGREKEIDKNSWPHGKLQSSFPARTKRKSRLAPRKETDRPPSNMIFYLPNRDVTGVDAAGERRSPCHAPHMPRPSLMDEVVACLSNLKCHVTGRSKIALTAPLRLSPAC